MAFVIQFPEASLGADVVIDDDDRVVYAYLRIDDRIVGDVWLYNRVTAPADVDWEDRASAPFLNPREFTNEAEGPGFDSADFRVQWESDTNGQPIARIFANEEILGILASGKKPGWSAYASRSGPLALSLREYK